VTSANWATYDLTAPATLSLYPLTVTASPVAGGAVKPVGAPGSPPTYNAGTVVNISATANTGFTFTGWTGVGTGSYTGSTAAAQVTMNGGITETANF
jgi:hypothetical protein